MAASLPTTDDGERQTRTPPPPNPAEPPEVLIIKPSVGWRALDLKEVWRYRELLWFLAVKDIKIRYKQTFLGAVWAVLQPLFTMVVFTIFFGKLGGLDHRIENGLPYSIYVFCALLPWQLFAHALAESSNSVVSNRAIITRVYFPRLILPVAPLVCGLLDFSISFGVLLIMLFSYGIIPGWAVLTLPFFIALAVFCSLAVGLWLSALNAIYRDVQYTLPFMTQTLMFLTPVAYPSNLVPSEWRWLYNLNPMAGVVDGFRWALLGQAEPPGPMLLVSLVSVGLIFVGGMFYFRRMEKYFADLA